MNDRLAIHDRIKKVLVEHAMVQKDLTGLATDASLIEELGLESIQVFEMIVGLEEEFGFSIADEELVLDTFATIDSITDYVRKKIS